MSHEKFKGFCTTTIQIPQQEGKKIQIKFLLKVFENTYIIVYCVGKEACMSQHMEVRRHLQEAIFSFYPMDTSTGCQTQKPMCFFSE